jgi:hypothetical protein
MCINITSLLSGIWANSIERMQSLLQLSKLWAFGHSSSNLRNGKLSRGWRNVPKGYFGMRNSTEWQGVKTSPGGHSRHIPIESEIPNKGVRPFLMRVSIEHIPDSKTPSRPLRLVTDFSQACFTSERGHARTFATNLMIANRAFLAE